MKFSFPRYHYDVSCLRASLPSEITHTRHAKSGPRTMPAYLRLIVRYIFTHMQRETFWGFFLQRMWRFIQLIPHRNWFKEAKLVASFICWDEIVTCNESSLRFLKARHLIDPLANQNSTKEKSRFAFLFSFVKTAICVIVTLFEGADLLLQVLPLHTNVKESAKGNNLSSAQVPATGQCVQEPIIDVLAT